MATSDLMAQIAAMQQQLAALIAAALGITYTIEFSPDLDNWEAATATPTVVADDGALEVACMPYPASVAGQPPRFVRVKVGLAP